MTDRAQLKKLLEITSFFFSRFINSPSKIEFHTQKILASNEKQRINTYESSLSKILRILKKQKQPIYAYMHLWIYSGSKLASEISIPIIYQSMDLTRQGLDGLTRFVLVEASNRVDSYIKIACVLIASEGNLSFGKYEGIILDKYSFFLFEALKEEGDAIELSSETFRQSLEY